MGKMEVFKTKDDDSLMGLKSCSACKDDMIGERHQAAYGGSLLLATLLVVTRLDGQVETGRARVNNLWSNLIKAAHSSSGAALALISIPAAYNKGRQCRRVVTGQSLVERRPELRLPAQ